MSTTQHTLSIGPSLPPATPAEAHACAEFYRRRLSKPCTPRTRSWCLDNIARCEAMERQRRELIEEREAERTAYRPATDDMPRAYTGRIE